MEYNKYLASILYFFVIKDNLDLLNKIEPIIDDPADFYYNYEQDNLSLRISNLFDHLVDKYVESQGEQFYKCMWNITHMVPLVMKVECVKMIEYYYKTYIMEKIGCVNCIMHYVYKVSESPDDIFTNKDKLFEFFVELHNEVNDERETKQYTVEEVKTMLKTNLENIYNM